MNHNEEVPDFLGGLGDMLPADVLKKVNELMEQLHRKDKDHQGSPVFIYAPGSQYVDTQINIGETHPEPDTLPVPPCVGRESGHIHQAKTQFQEERIRQCIALLMMERYGDEPLFCLQGHWQAVYRILVDKGYCRDSDFDGFDAFIRRVMPKEVNKPYKKDSVKQVSKTDFALPFERWHYDPQTSTTRKPYDRMVAIATRFKEILEENGL
jgi:hypothetical protein